MTVSYRDAAIVYWGEAGAYAYDAYARLRAGFYPELPDQLPIVIGLTAYGACLGLTRGRWEHGPRITLPPEIFRGTTAQSAGRKLPGGDRLVDDVLAHEMLHVSLGLAGLNSKHDGAPWYDAVRRLSPAVLGWEIGAHRGADRKSVRIPNPAYEPGGDEPKTLVRKVPVDTAVQHADVAGWPGAFRPDGYYCGPPIPCPT